jgi:glycosyltransferase involved in cell wall biosynthesis
MLPHIAHATVVHGRYDIRILYKQCASLAGDGRAEVSLFVADDLGDECWQGVRIRSIGQPRHGRIGRAVIGSIALWRALRQSRPDLVHLHDPELLPLGLALHARGTPVVFDMHENLPREIMTKEWVLKPLRTALSRVVAAFQRRACRILPTVFAELSYAADFPSANAGVVVLNFPLLRSLLHLDAAKHATFTVGYIGGVSAERGAHESADAIERLNRDGIRVAGVFVGPLAAGLDRQEPFARAVAGGYVTATGRLAPTDGWPLIARCHVGIALLRPSPNFVDSYPTKLFEYMALGLPVVVSDFPLWRRAVSDAGCGLLVDPMDPGAIAAALRWLHDHPAEATAMGERGRAAVRAGYSWDSEFEKLRALYDRLLPRGRELGLV